MMPAPPPPLLDPPCGRRLHDLDKSNLSQVIGNDRIKTRTQNDPNRVICAEKSGWRNENRSAKVGDFLPDFASQIMGHFFPSLASPNKNRERKGEIEPKLTRRTSNVTNARPLLIRQIALQKQVLHKLLRDSYVSFRAVEIGVVILQRTATQLLTKDVGLV